MYCHTNTRGLGRCKHWCLLLDRHYYYALQYRNVSLQASVLLLARLHGVGSKTLTLNRGGHLEICLSFCQEEESQQLVAGSGHDEAFKQAFQGT